LRANEVREAIYFLDCFVAIAPRNDEALPEAELLHLHTIEYTTVVPNQVDLLRVLGYNIVLNKGGGAWQMLT
jgi:hypothetical protein